MSGHVTESKVREFYSEYGAACQLFILTVHDLVKKNDREGFSLLIGSFDETLRLAQEVFASRDGMN